MNIVFIKSIFSFVLSLIILLIVFLLGATRLSVYAQTQNVSASIGEYYINLSGYIAPNASVVLLSDNVVLRTTVADSNGYFYITGVLINSGLTSFCLDGIDFKRIGESYTCFSVPPAQGNITMNNIFLPPTLGLQRTEITAGQEALAWGYSMPNAAITIHSSDGKIYTVTADATGFYQLSIKINSAGKYQFFAEATYKNSQSHTPDKKIELTALSETQNIVKDGTQNINNIGHFLFGVPWAVLFILAPLLVGIVYYLKKLKPEWFTFIDFGSASFLSDLTSKMFHDRKLHHAWFVGY